MPLVANSSSFDRHIANPSKVCLTRPILFVDRAPICIEMIL